MSLRVALHAHIDAADGIQPRRIDDGASRGTSDVVAPRSMAPLASHVPFRDGLVLDVVVDGMASVAERAGRTGDAVRPPDAVRDVPLRGQRKEIAVGFPEVALFELAPVHQRDVVDPERPQWFRL